MSLLKFNLINLLIHKI